MADKSTVDEIRQRFDADVERFSNLRTGQSATIDAPLVLELIAEAAAATTPGARRLLDLGCGAGNYSLRLLAELPGLGVDLVDLSRPMLDRAEQRLRAYGVRDVRTVQADLRDLDLEPERYDAITAGAVLHHLRDDAEWDAVFGALYRALRPGGALWVSDLVTHSVEAVQALMWTRYGDYLSGLRDDAYRDRVFAYVEREDSPRPLVWQLDRLRAAGFERVDVLHKTGVFAAFSAVKGEARTA